MPFVNRKITRCGQVFPLEVRVQYTVVKGLPDAAPRGSMVRERGEGRLE